MGNMVTAATLYGTGDVLAQTIQKFHGEKSQNPAILTPTPHELDASRTLRNIAYGAFVFGPVGHWWYGFVQNKIFWPLGKNAIRGGQSALDVASRVVVDQLCFAPVGVAAYLGAMGLMSGDTVGKVKQKLDDTWMDTVIANWAVWPAIQVFTFAWVPLNQRVGFVGVLGVFWNAYLSWTATKSSSKREIMA